MPNEVSNYIYPVELRNIYSQNQWVIVRTCYEFVKQIEENGLPECVFLDHDLADGALQTVNNNPDGDCGNDYTGGTFKEKNRVLC